MFELISPMCEPSAVDSIQFPCTNSTVLARMTAAKLVSLAHTSNRNLISCILLNLLLVKSPNVWTSTYAHAERSMPHGIDM